MTTVTRPPAWYDDPTARHRLRYWDGEHWTSEVSDAGDVGIDELRVLPQPAPIQPRRPWYTHWWIFFLAFVVLAIGIIVPIRLNTNPASVTPAPVYPGRLLIARGTEPVTVQALTSASTKAVRVGTVPLEEDAKWASPDGTHLVADNGTIATVGAESVEYLPELQSHEYYAVSSADFSRDGTKLAYAAAEGGTVVVYDVVSKVGHVVLQTSCESYGFMYTSVCGAAAGVAWIDDATLFVWHFAGEMPQQVSCSGPSSGYATSCSEPAANTHSIVTTDGAILVSRPGTVAPVMVRGSTVVLADETWLDVNELRAGTATPKSLPAGALLDSLSTDGTRVVVPGDPWRAIDIRTGGVQLLGTRGAVENLQAPCRWSADGAYLAVQIGDDVRVVPMSIATGGTAGSTDGQLIAWTN